ncbi:hypothetical protein TRM7615_01229 [Falsiruegeria mediterranea M17]|uniref:Integrase catalytic domain-containing protein n=1 Tax=Falsiruegeria mediterranea M17 TaxID=1200281 RepID=A0A2R8C5P3_9RHOB|nr:hypothetical protein TRM7615_01229 [Falsiruegeria mediterranea M17]
MIRYPTRDNARRDVFDYIELFYNPKRKHTNNSMLSPGDYENKQRKPKQAGVSETWGTTFKVGILQRLNTIDENVSFPKILTTVP